VSSVALLVNPTAGKGRAEKLAGDATERLRQHGLSVAVLIGADADEALDLAKVAVKDGVDAVVALGGDGMVHLALQAVAGTGTPLGIIPAGTGNDLAAMFDLPVHDAAKAADLIARQLAAAPAGRAVDAVRAAGKWFGCVLGAGFDSKVNDRANRLTWPRGRARYNLAILAELRVFQPLPFTLTFDDAEPHHTDAMLVAVGNARSYGAGMRITPEAVIDDGLLDVTILGPVSKPEFLRTFPKVYKGTHITHPKVTTRRARTVRIESPNVTAYADGEFLADLPVTCECVPGALRILAP
jgi:diacylglycerol kinase (ATP)